MDVGGIAVVGGCCSRKGEDTQLFGDITIVRPYMGATWLTKKGDTTCMTE